MSHGVVGPGPPVTVTLPAPMLGIASSFAVELRCGVVALIVPDVLVVPAGFLNFSVKVAPVVVPLSATR